MSAMYQATELLHIKDRSGCTITIERIGDYVFGHGYPSEKSKRATNGLNDLDAEEFFDDDILICSYPRSGYHWTLEILGMLVRGNTEYDDVTALAHNIEFRPVELLPQNEPRPRILHTHLPLFMLPEKLKKLRTIFIYRNPKDVSYSHYKNLCEISVIGYDGKFEDFILLFQDGQVALGDWFRYMNSWEEFIIQNEKCVISYEDLTEDTVAVTKKLAEYIGIKRDESFIEEVINKCNLQSMKKNKLLSPVAMKSGAEGYLRKGQVGGWKEHFTVAMSEEFDDVFKKRMADSKLKFRFQL